MSTVLTRADILQMGGSGVAVVNPTPQITSPAPSASITPQASLGGFPLMGDDEELDENPLQTLERILGFISNILERIEAMRAQGQGQVGQGDAYIQNAQGTVYTPPTLPQTPQIAPPVQSAPNLGMSVDEVKKIIELIPDEQEFTGEELKKEVKKWLK